MKWDEIEYLVFTFIGSGYIIASLIYLNRGEVNVFIPGFLFGLVLIFAGYMMWRFSTNYKKQQDEEKNVSNGDYKMKCPECKSENTTHVVWVGYDTLCQCNDCKTIFVVR